MNDQRPILIVECKEDRYPSSLMEQQRLIMELLAYGSEYSHTRSIQDILFYDGTFPTDVRHNVKIQREKLALWAANQLHIPLPQTGFQADHKADTAYIGKRKSRRGVIAVIVGAISLVLGVVASVLFLRKKSKSEGKPHER
jgi:hypothetical protein